MLLQARKAVGDLTIFMDLREVESTSLVKFAPDLTKKVLFPNTLDNMDAKKAEAVRVR